MRTSSTRRIGALSLAALVALVFSFASPALAGGKAGERRTEGGWAERPWVSGSDDDDSVVDDDPDTADTDNAHPSGNDRHEDNGTQGFSASEPDDDGHGQERESAGFEGTDKPGDPDGEGGVDDADQDGNNGCGNDDDFEDDNEGWCGKPASAGPEVGGNEVTKPECPERNTMGDANGQGPKGCSTTTSSTDCPTPAEVAAGAEMPEGCDEEDEGGVLSGTTSCPKEGEVLPSGSTMPAGCTTTVPGGVTATAATVAPGAVLGSELQQAPAAAAAAAADEASVLGIQLERPAAVGGTAGAAGTSVLGAALARTGLGFTALAVALALGLLAVGFALRRSARTEA